ncbi:Glucanosyltransferase-domain-containing protein [Massariosphaeria phaeospora]|uniref:1,3-beta-glucanosyltransferase n=1 Tax=Massariosphaeria phaeospora TaxID=100035 RepID=A0A7C8M275_9PLEO|nr:Glucanosyltransferase-domain-containing protein [Massariosphaeria phaeospora]
MKSFVALLALGASVVPALGGMVTRQSQSKGKSTPVEVKGNAFFAGDKRFYVRGVAYQPGGAADAKDPLLDLKGLERDIKNFKSLGINTIRVYTIDNAKNHDKAMQMLDDAGIYLALDANTPKYSLNRETQATLHRSYNDVYLQSVFATVDAFADYTNLLLFFSGNEVINAKNNTGAATYIKAVTRDMKRYISNTKSRPIPVGYSAADVAENIEQQALFFNCGTDDERSDFFAFNDYSWCDPSSFKEAGWDKKVETYKDYSKPIFLSEFGCITNKREWKEINSLYGDDMTSVYSGGLAYEYTEEPNGYGLVSLENGEIKTNDDFDTLKKQYAAVKTPSGSGGFKENGKASECPPADDEWEVTSTILPEIPSKALDMMKKGAGTAPGLDGDGSHFAGETSASEATPGSGAATRVPNGQAAAGGDGSGAAAGVDVPLRFVAMLGASVLFGVVLLF